MLLAERAKALQQANPALKAFADMQGKGPPHLTSKARLLGCLIVKTHDKTQQSSCVDGKALRLAQITLVYMPLSM